MSTAKSPTMSSDDTRSGEGKGRERAKAAVKAKRRPKAAAPKKAAPKAAARPKAAGRRPRETGRAVELQRAAERLKQVSDATRLRVLLILAEDPHNVTQLRDQLGGISQPALSHHLALLRHGRLIEPTRNGKTNVYDLTDAGRELAKVVGRLLP